jgi:hypothetical protein
MEKGTFLTLPGLELRTLRLGVRFGNKLASYVERVMVGNGTVLVPRLG